MRLFSLVYNSFIWGILAAIIAFQSEWLEMRINIGIIIPLVMIICLLFGMFQKKIRRDNFAAFDFKASIINLLICSVAAFMILGIERVQVVPASIIREGIKMSKLSFTTINIFLAILLIIGLLLCLLVKKEPKTYIFGGNGSTKESMELRNIFKGNKGKALSVLIVIVFYLAIPPIRININKAIDVLKNVNVDSAREYILSFGIWAPVVSFLLMILQSVAAPLPAFIITFANAGLFGWVKGAALSWSSAMAGAALCFFIARFLGRDVVEKLTTRIALEKIDEFFKQYGKYAILIARLLPFISFDLVSYAAGLTSMNFWSFFIATGIGQLPATIVYSYIGGMLTGTVKTFVMGLLILFAVSALIVLMKKMWSDKKEIKLK